MSIKLPSLNCETRIICENIIDSNGVESNNVYIEYTFFKFFGIKLWDTINEKIYYTFDTEIHTRNFHTIENAKNLLMMNSFG